jgi:hypothetical protein
MEKFVEEVEYEGRKPVSIEREAHDVVVIEGVRYAADIFRVLANPDANVLYTFERDGENVIATVIRNVGEATGFFFRKEYGRGDPAPTDGGS